MSFVKVLATAALLAVLATSAAGLTAESLDSARIPNPWKPDFGPKCQIAAKRGCNGGQDCCRSQFCFRCPICDNVFDKPGSCTPISNARPSCAAPPPCDIVCPEKSCSSSDDCCSFQTCIKCPVCISNGSEVKFEGKCVAFKPLGGPSFSRPSPCPKPPLPRCEPGKCERREDCGPRQFCFRCAKCEGRFGPVFDRPGFCLSVDGPIPGCVAPRRCEDELILKPAVGAEGP